MFLSILKTYNSGYGKAERIVYGSIDRFFLGVWKSVYYLYIGVDCTQLPAKQYGSVPG